MDCSIHSIDCIHYRIWTIGLVCWGIPFAGQVYSHPTANASWIFWLALAQDEIWRLVSPIDWWWTQIGRLRWISTWNYLYGFNWGLHHPGIIVKTLSFCLFQVMFMYIGFVLMAFSQIIESNIENLNTKIIY